MWDVTHSFMQNLKGSFWRASLKLAKTECHPTALPTVPIKTIKAQVNTWIGSFSKHRLISYSVPGFEGGFIYRKKEKGNPGTCSDSWEYEQCHCLSQVLEMETGQCVYKGQKKWLAAKPGRQARGTHQKISWLSNLDLMIITLCLSTFKQKECISICLVLHYSKVLLLLSIFICNMILLSDIHLHLA